LLPHVVREALQRKSVLAASASFGVVALILLLVLLIEWDGIGSIRPSSKRPVGFGVVVVPLLVVVLLTIAARIARVVH
jgi:hypothetical protein